MRSLILVLLLMSTPVMARDRVLHESLPETDIRIEFSHSVSDEKAQQLRTWVRDTVESVQSVYGRFPTPMLTVKLRSTWSWGSQPAVSFGRTTRSNGGTVELFIDPDRPIDEFYANWTATHEFSHLMLPLLHREHRWISEGFASYYQNVLMARSGHYAPEYAWQQIRAGIERGKASRPDLSPNAASRPGTRDARMKYYWTGAALALMADVTLRERTNGRESLDTVLGELEHCCLPARYRWSGPGLFRRLDQFVGEPCSCRFGVSMQTQEHFRMSTRNSILPSIKRYGMPLCSEYCSQSLIKY